ncbi:hypothetical protein Trydic_g13423 [Trypoxylus dichotomus]
MEGDTVKNLLDKYETLNKRTEHVPNTNHSNDKLSDSSNSILTNSKNVGQDNVSAFGGVHIDGTDEAIKHTTTAERISKFTKATSKDRLSRKPNARDVSDCKRSKSLERQMATKLNESASSHVRERCRSTKRINYVGKHTNNADDVDANSQNRPSPKPIHPDINVADPQNRIPAPLLSPNPNYANEMQSDVIKPPKKDIASTILTDAENLMSSPPPPPMPMYNTLVKRRQKNVANKNLQKRMSVPVFFSPSVDTNEIHSDVIRRPNKNTENNTDKLSDSSNSILTNSKNVGQDNVSAFGGGHIDGTDETVKHTTTAERINKFTKATSSKDRLSRKANARDVSDCKRSKSLERQMATKLNESASSHVRERCRSTKRIRNYVGKHTNNADDVDANSQNRPSPKPIHPDEIQSYVKCSNINVATPQPSPKPIYVDEIPPDVEGPNKNVAYITFMDPQNRIPAPPLSSNQNYANEMQSNIVKPPKKDVANTTITDPENRMSIPPPPPMSMYNVLVQRRHKNVANRNLQKRMSVPVFFSPSEDMSEIHSDAIRRSNNNAESTGTNPQDRRLYRESSAKIPHASESSVANSKGFKNVAGNQKNNITLSRCVTMANNWSLWGTKGRWESTDDVGYSAIRYPTKDDADNSPICPQNRTPSPPPPPKPNNVNITPSCLPDLDEDLETLSKSTNSVENSSQNTEREEMQRNQTDSVMESQKNVKKPIGIAIPLIQKGSKLRGSPQNLKVVLQDSAGNTKRHRVIAEGNRIIIEPLSSEDEESATKYEQILERSTTYINDERPRSTTSLYVIQELLQTELAYFQGLQTVYKEYIVYFERSDILSSSDIRKIFGNFEDIYKNQCDFYMALAECNNDVDDIAEAFLKNKMLFDLYKDYILNKPSSHEHLIGQCSDAIKARDQELGNELGLHSFLAAPLQRLIRYRLLLKTLDDAFEKEIASNAKLTVAIAYLDDLIESTNLQPKLMVDKSIPLNITKVGKLLMMDDCSWRNSGQKHYGTIILFQELVVLTKKTCSRFKTMKTVTRIAYA